MMPSSFEDKVAGYFKEEGWEVLRNGWPDLLCVRPRKGGGYDLMAVEVKSKRDKLRDNQKRNLAMLSTVMPVREVREGPGYGNRTLPKAGDVAVLIYDMERYQHHEGGDSNAR
jgi:hypothetical protein